ncbi:gamma-glutamyl-gamma-aminobutyrate hydrolase family protein [bacterium]|nr:gamma-glutamyl-gamma-aminobutyrate hydrolase family protein [bacterium]
MPPSAGVSLSAGEKVLARYAAWLASWGWEAVVVGSPDELAGHGLLFLGGGGDVGPQTGAYGDEEAASPLLTNVDSARDGLEMDLLACARRLGLPVFGTCRGLQVMNLFLGGTLHADLAACGLDAGAHRLAGAPSVEAADVFHAVRPDSGPSFEVCSNHHQAIASLAPGLVATSGRGRFFRCRRFGSQLTKGRGPPSRQTGG